MIQTDVALPRVGSNACENSALRNGLGKDAFIENKGASASAPKPYLAKETAAHVGRMDGGKSQTKAANFRRSEYGGDGLSAIAKSTAERFPLVTFNSRSHAVTVKRAPHELPSRGSLARKWPNLRVNRLTWRWRDDASGAKGDDITSLLAFLNMESNLRQICRKSRFERRAR